MVIYHTCVWVFVSGACPPRGYDGFTNFKRMLEDNLEHPHPFFKKVDRRKDAPFALTAVGAVGEWTLPKFFPPKIFNPTLLSAKFVSE